MAKLTFVLAILFIISVIGFGMYADLPHSTFASAVVLEQQSQQGLNICMNDCMRSCVTIPGTEQSCLEQCTIQCNA